MPDMDTEKLLGDRRVVEEIQRHLWIQSEKVGFDVGFENAKLDWLKNFSKAWMEYHMPEELLKAKKAAAVKALAPESEQEKAKKDKAAPVKRRRAKSYFA
ncbi:MAG: hypothetical protein Q8Q08_12300 [Candidatus Omnitrophota bacterium]|nr:hypothetical protein [Candidatus Omnitrophota bacterium]MDZ4241330.1 hypothetical protein [Candidatus Omnitrophota bacterium]